VTLTQQRGWSNTKRLAAVRRGVDAAVQDPVASGATVIAAGGAILAAVLLPKPMGFVVPVLAVGSAVLGWSTRRAGQPVSFLIDRARWEERRHELAAIPDLEVEVDGDAKAVDHEGTVYDVRLTCRRRDAGAVQRAL